MFFPGYFRSLLLSALILLAWWQRVAVVRGIFVVVAHQIFRVMPHEMLQQRSHVWLNMWRVILRAILHRISHLNPGLDASIV